MADPVDQYQQEETATQNQALVQAHHTLGWDSAFKDGQSPEVLRDRRDYTALVNQALDSKMRLAAQTDNSAQRLYENTQKFNEWQQQAPQRDALTEARIAATNARASKEAAQERTAAQHSAMLDTQASNLHNRIAALNEQYPDRTDPKYHQGVIDAVFESPLAAKNDPAVQAMLKTTAETADDALAAKQTYDANSGAQQYFTPDALLKENPGSEYRQDPKTGGFVVTIGRGAKQDSTPDIKIPPSAYTELGKLNAQKASDSVYLTNESDPTKKALLQKKINATDAAIGAWHSTYGGDTAPPPPPAQKATDSLDTKDAFTTAFNNAKPGEILKFKGKEYKKP